MWGDTRKRLDKLEHIVLPNGQPGVAADVVLIKTALAEMKERQASHRRVTWMILGGVAVNALAGHLGAIIKALG